MQSTALATVRKVALVICTNPYNWHDHPFVEYLIYNGKFFDRPSYGKCLRAIQNLPQGYVVVVEKPCYLCYLEGK
jgi:DNA invertase Pin-like site-specific DNA recombinase